MLRRISVFAVLVIIGVVFAGSAQHMYVVYYSRSPQQDLEVSILNASSSEAGYRIDAYDAHGTLSWQQTGQLAINWPTCAQ